MGVVGVLLACSNTKKVNVSEKQVEKFDVVINATTTQVYCGGVGPSEEVIKELNTPTPSPNVKLYLRKGDSNDIENEVDYQFLTDDSGKVIMSLPAGMYSIVFENKKDRATYDALLEKYGKETSYQTAIDTNCLRQFFVQPNAVLIVEEKNENIITVNRRLHCQWTRIPCSNYKGDLPPTVSPK